MGTFIEGKSILKNLQWEGERNIESTLEEISYISVIKRVQHIKTNAAVLLVYLVVSPRTRGQPVLLWLEPLCREWWFPVASLFFISYTGTIAGCLETIGYSVCIVHHGGSRSETRKKEVRFARTWSRRGSFMKPFLRKITSDERAAT